MAINFKHLNGTQLIGDGTYKFKCISLQESSVIYTATVTGLGNSDPSTVTFEVDSGFPTSFKEWTDSNGNIFVKIPTMYRKINTVSGSQITSFTIATAKVDDTYEPYPVFVEPDGTIMDYVCIGKYCMSSSATASSTTSSSVNMTMGTARTLARAVGYGYQQYDWQFQKLFVDLALVISQKVNFQDGSSTISSYLGIHNMNETIWVDGVVKIGTTWCISYNPAKYIDRATSITDGYVVGGDAPNANGYIMKLDYHVNHTFFGYPRKVGGSGTTYFCDYFYYVSGGCPICTLVGYPDKSYGLWFCRAHLAWTDQRCARLCYRPLHTQHGGGTEE